MTSASSVSASGRIWSVSSTTSSYGCGTSSNVLRWAKARAQISGIDISGAAIDRARHAGHRDGLSVRFLVMDAESLGFDEGSFDVVVGSGILHHLALRQSRVLRPDGCAVFVDPLGHNIFIRLYRKLTPSMRTADEHPLLDQGNSTGRAIFPRSRRIFHAAGPGRRAVPEDAGVPCPGTSR